jgi:hypothetical protein
MCVMALGAIGAIGSIVSGVAAYQSAQANAAMAKTEAKRDAQLGALEEANYRRRAEKEMGQQAVDMAQAGLSISDGSTLMVAYDSARQAEMNASLIRTDWFMKKEAAENRAAIYKSQGTNALIGSAFNAGADLLRQAPSAPALS